MPVPTSLVVVGASAGGLKALEVVLGGLPTGFPVPVVAVQHRARESTEAFAEVLSRGTTLPVREVDDDDPLRAPGVYLAPPDYHVLIEPGRVALSVDDPVSFSRPSIDVLFESAADAYGSGVLAVLLTGANADGAAGVARVKEAGGFAIVQDPHTAESPEMPSAAIALAPVDRVLPLSEIAEEILRVVRSGAA
ncbi:MAG: chemotaxis protein CheB [Deltaproteobacteria bacterium]|nr:chemotaxis protein CheB [Deltaproteobacteria bacterium]